MTEKEFDKELKKQTLGHFLLSLITFTFLYAVFAFINFDFNIAHWDAFGRYSFAFLYIFMQTLIVTGFAVNYAKLKTSSNGK